jgi:hypothetical protein
MPYAFSLPPACESDETQALATSPGAAKLLKLVDRCSALRTPSATGVSDRRVDRSTRALRVGGLDWVFVAGGEDLNLRPPDYETYLIASNVLRRFAKSADSGTELGERDFTYDSQEQSS